MIVRYRAQALADIDAIFDFLREHSLTGAQNVVRAIYAGVHLIAEQPLSSVQTDIANVRVKIVRQYRYKIFYSVTDSGIEILHVRHTSRREGRP